MTISHNDAFEKYVENSPIVSLENAPIESSDVTDCALLAFETRYAEAQRERADEKAKKQAKPKSPDKPKPETNRYQIEADELRRLVHERLENGYVLPFPMELAGRYRQPFTEPGLRSADNPVLKLFVSLVPVGGKARASNDKARLEVQSRSKLLTLDYPYIELNKAFLGAIRIDCDGVFQTPDHLLHELELLVKARKIPCLPHIIVGDLMGDGTYRRPHFIFLLPPGRAVWNSKDARCRMDIVRLLVGVYNGLCKAMLHIGADPSAPATTMRMKNPLSPIWHTITPNWQHMPTLSDFSKCVDMKANRQKLVRRAAVVQSGMGITPSNALFNNLREQAAKLLVEWHFDADVRITGSRATLADHLHVALEKFAKGAGLDELKVAYVISKVADYMSVDFDPSKLQKRRNRGQILHVVENMKSVRERQRAGSRYSNEVRKSRSLEKLIAVYRTMLERVEDLSPEQLASRARVSRSTAYRHFEACQQICASECIDKKEPEGSPIHNPIETMDARKTAKSQFNLLTSRIGKIEDLESVFMTDSTAEDDDVRLIEEHDTWIAAQESPAHARQTHSDLSNDPDIIFEDKHHLAALET